jgi:hypothetical protein
MADRTPTGSDQAFIRVQRNLSFEQTTDVPQQTLSTSVQDRVLKLNAQESELQTEIAIVQKEVSIAELENQLSQLKIKRTEQQRPTNGGNPLQSHAPIGQGRPLDQPDDFTVQDLRRLSHLQAAADHQMNMQDSWNSRNVAAQEGPPLREGKMKSGREAKLTDRVIRPQQWPHTHLALQFVNKDVGYDDLSMAQFVAGYTAILTLLPPGSPERCHRVIHLQDLMYYACSFTWKSVLEFHAAALLEVERGRRQWGDSFRDLDTHLFHGRGRLAQQGTGIATGGTAINNTTGGRRQQWFCQKFQTGQCDNARKEHFALVGSERRWVRHVCATCWLTDKQSREHPESAKDCPYYKTGQNSKLSVAAHQ